MGLCSRFSSSFSGDDNSRALVRRLGGAGEVSVRRRQKTKRGHEEADGRKNGTTPLQQKRIKHLKKSYPPSERRREGHLDSRDNYRKEKSLPTTCVGFYVVFFFLPSGGAVCHRNKCSIKVAGLLHDNENELISDRRRTCKKRLFLAIA